VKLGITPRATEALSLALRIVDKVLVEHQLRRNPGVHVMNKQEMRAVKAADFRVKVEALGGTVLGVYVNNQNKVHVRCSAGHDCFVMPNSVQQGKGICGFCAGNGAAGAEAAFMEFRSRVEAQGGRVLEPKWLGNHTGHYVICAAGHDCYPRPATVRYRGSNICVTCSYVGRNDAKSNATWAAFKARIEALGGTVLEPYWLGNNTPHRVRCCEGHEGATAPNHLLSGRGMCRTCVGQDPIAAEKKFRSKVAELGGTVLGAYVDTRTPVHVRCKEGHDNHPWPGAVSWGQGICGTCVGMSPAVAEADFIQRVAVLGGTVLGKYIKSVAPVLVRCPAGHDCYPIPSNIRRGQGICRLCKGKVWDVFYLMAGKYSFKLGITSGDPNGRIRDHHPNGYTKLVLLFTRLPGTVAKNLEDKLKRDLPASCYPPIERTEIFANDALNLALYIIDVEMIEYRSYCVTGAEFLWPELT
jgi:hypothetical protein